MSKEKKEWVITSTVEDEPSYLSEIAILTDEDEITLDQVAGKDFAIAITKNKPINSHWNSLLKFIAVKSMDDVLVLFHEMGHGVLEEEDKFVKKIKGKIEAKIKTGEKVDDLSLKEVGEIVAIREERLASAYALRKIRQLKRERGIDLLRGQDFKEIQARIHRGIESQFNSIRSTKEYKEKLQALRLRIGLKE